MSRTSLPTLEQLIRQRIYRRIAIAVALMVGTALLLTLAEGVMSLSKRLDSLKLRAAHLQDLVISEILVHNSAAVDAILKDANAQHPYETVVWIPQESSEVSSQESLRWEFTGDWIFKMPLRTWGDQKFGSFVFQGNVFEDNALVFSFTYRVLLVAVSCFVLCLVLLPIAKRAPEDLILKPMRRLLAIIDSEKDDRISIEKPEFSELKDIESELRSLLDGRKQRENEQIEVEKSKAIAQTAHMLAHDIRRPFALLKASVDGMALVQTLDAMKKLRDRALPRLHSSFSSLDAMIDELSLLGRPHVIPANRVDMSKAIAQASETTVALHTGMESCVSLEIEPELFVFGNAADLKRVVSNLVSNALQAMSSKDTLKISGSRLGDAVILRVENSGSYIPPDEQRSIFNPFYTKGKASGSGLGLAICKRIVSSYESGNITVESNPEKGTTFVVSIPAATEKILSDSHAGQESLSRHGTMRVLIADDDIFFREAVENTVLALKDDIKTFEVTPASSAEDAVKLAMSTDFDAIVIDINFGDGRMDGISAVRMMRCEGVKARICVHTNRSDQTTLEDAIDAGADAFLPKPMTQEGLRRFLG